ncbi:hypothetical protein [Georgenia sp. SUBG003]|uniref:hypothetical protein n=1 Tax=Georgenia sp. SUBG003 TaxID=1497974 RepID=UPI0004D46F0B|nr:membrane protein [Georgenia sp. SUBG003]
MEKKRWSDLSGRQRAALLALASVQVSLAVSAWTDLAVREPELVRGSKAKWAAVIAINFVGPVLYYSQGRVAR